MNEKLQYAKMLDIPVSTCNVTYKPPKKRWFKFKRKIKDEQVKEKLLEKINAENEEVSPVDTVEPLENLEQDVAPVVQPLGEEEVVQVDNEEPIVDTVSTVSVTERKLKKKTRIGVIGIQLCVIGALVATVFLTSAFYPGASIATFFGDVFGTAKEEAVLVYNDFSPVIANGSLKDGSVVVSGKASVYSPCNGTISEVTLLSNGKYAVTVTHSPVFSTVISGLDLIYGQASEEVVSNIPLGFVFSGDVAITFYNGDDMITDFSLETGTVVWAV